MDIPVGAVVSDHSACSEVGRDVLKRGGSAVDAAVTMSICNGVRTPHSLGVGGGLFMVIHQKGSRESVYIDGRSVTPSRMTKLLFKERLQQNETSCKIAVPGALRAYKLAHDKYGRLPWSELFQPAIRMLREGFPMAESTENAYYLHEIYPERHPIDRSKYPVLCSVFRSNGRDLRAGDTMHIPKLAEALEDIAEQGPNYMYDSPMTNVLVQELQQQGGVHIVEDFQKYEARSGRAYTMEFNDHILHTAQGASCGIIIGMTLNILKGYRFAPSHVTTLSNKADAYHKLLEVFKFVMPIKDQHGDPDFDDVKWIFDNAKCDAFATNIRDKILEDRTHGPDCYSDVSIKTVDDGGTSHMSVLSPEGDAVSCTSTISTYFGSKIMSPSTGIIWNDAMDGFPTTGVETVMNRLEPGKRPRSCMSPIIITDKQGAVKLVIGAAGAVRIVTAVVQVIANLLWFKLPLPDAVAESRMHFNTNDECILVEEDFSEELREMLVAKGHDVQVQPRYQISVVQTIFINEKRVIQAYADSRKRPGKALYVYSRDIN